MAISYVSSSNTTYASRTNLTVTAPASIADGDILIATIITAASSEAPDPSSTPTGFSTTIGSTIDVANGGFNVEMRTYIKVASGESGNYTWNHSSCTSQGCIQVFRGVDTTTPQDTTATANNGTGSTSTWTGLTTATANAWIVAIGFDWADAAANLSPPTGMTERLEVNPLVYVASELITSAGATGNRTHTNNNLFGASSGRGERLIALRPAASARVLDADAGSYAITGTAAGTQRNRLVDAAAGSYAVTGTAAGTQLGRQVAALAGSYAVSGTAVTFPKTWILDASAGSYSLTGTAAGLQVGHVLDAAAGSYAISGQTAALTVGYQVAAGAGSYAVTGADATFPRTYLLDAGAGAYTVSGTDAALTIQSFGAYLLDADGGAYLISGQSAALLASHADLTADAGAYDITGDDAGLAYALVLEAAGGEYLFTGSPATLVYDGEVEPEPEPEPPARTHGGGGRWGTSGRRIVWPKKKRDEWEEFVRREIRKAYGHVEDVEEAVEAVAPYIPTEVDPRAVQAVVRALVPDAPLAEIKRAVAPLVDYERLRAMDDDLMSILEVRWQSL